MRSRVPSPRALGMQALPQGLLQWLDWVHRILASELPELLTGTKTWNPSSVASGAYTSTTLSVSRAEVGQPVAVGFSQAVPAGVLLVGAVTSSGTVTVTMQNGTAGAVNLSEGTLRACVWAY